MTRFAVIGKGPVGSALARHLSDRGDDVVVISRSGAPAGHAGHAGISSTHGAAGTADADDAEGGPAAPDERRHVAGSVEHVAADASDPEALTRAATGATAIINAANPRYDRWPSLWPALNESAMVAAERTQAVLVTAANLYGYGAGSGVMTEQAPQHPTEPKGRVRAQMWRDALDRHEAGRIRATEVRAGDYVGPGATGPAHAGEMLFGPLLAGKALRPVGDPHQPHAWTYLPDYVAALVAAAEQEAAWGRPWIAPTNPAISYTDLVTLFAREAGVLVPPIKPVPTAILRAIGAFAPRVREVARVMYQFDAPFVADSRVSERELGVAATPWDAIARETTAWWQTRTAGQLAPR